MAQCIQPYRVLLPNGNEQPVRCGKCPTCYASRASEWSVRLMEEESISKTSHFVTFTYDNDNVHLTENGFMGLNKNDIQKYFKRLRKAHVGNAKSSIRYYCVGEYGGRTKRPHYHALIFNADEQLIEDAWSIKGKKLGQVFFGTVTGNSVGYCLKYMTKVSKIGLSYLDDRIPQFALMSKGLGASYIEKMIFWHRDDLENRMYIPLQDGKKATMPRYYKERIYFNTEREDIGWITLRRSLDEMEKLLTKHGDKLSRQLQESKRVAFDVMKHNYLSTSKL